MSMKDFDLDLSKKRILLVGGAGFIGHNLAIRLRNLGAFVEVADSFAVNSILNLKLDPNKGADISVYKDFLDERIDVMKDLDVMLSIFDATNRYEVTKILDNNYDIVYLLAAVSHASRSNDSPINAFDNGLLPFHHFVSALADKPTTRLVYLSSSTVYGNFTKPVVDETDTCSPFGMYAVLKHTGERLLQEISKHSDLNYSIVRPSALYGERCISRRVSQIFLENAFAGRKLVFRGNLDETLDFTYIGDLVQGLVLAGVHEGARNESFNITYGNARPVIYLAEILKEYFKNVVLEIEERVQATPIRGTLNNDKAKKLLGYEPQWPLEKGYCRYIEWYLKRSRDRSMVFNTISQLND